jgi:hypothetical protein
MLFKTLLWLAVFLCFGGHATTYAQNLESQPRGTIAADTKITVANWQNFRQFMSEGMSALFEGNRFWRVPQEIVVEVGPTTPIPLPAKYLADTEKFSGRVKLTRLPTGGYVPEGYVAGTPFPHPLSGDPALIGQRIFWNSYYRYQPRVQGARNFSYTLDRAGNMTQTSEVTEVNSQLAFLSDVGLPNKISDTSSYYLAKFQEQIAPEQSKYTTLLDLIPTDPTRLDELYEYVPSLRRSLRLSQAARCAPVFGSDYLIDDENEGPPGLPQLFKIEYLGEKKILALEHATPSALDSPGTPTQLDPRYYYRGSSGIVPLPKPTAGRWEIRDSYVISIERLPQFADGYCYGRRVIYIDQENYFSGAQLDLYDPAGELYKSQLIFSYPARVPGTNGDVAQLAAGPNTSYLINFKDQHVSISPSLRSCVNSDCEKSGYLDVTRYASPEGLMKIVQ